MKLTLRALAALLGYPSAELQQNIGEIHTALRSEALLPVSVLTQLEPLLDAFATGDLLDLQVAYSDLFDSGRSLSLHLFEHVHGESRDRGQAMIDLGQQYLDHGYIPDTNELPDYLPLFLEFLSCLPEAQARDWLSQPAHVLAVLEERLRQKESIYAAVLQGLLVLPSAQPDPQAIAELAEREPHRSIDDDWEEPPVDFSAPLSPSASGSPTLANAAARASLIATSKS